MIAAIVGLVLAAGLISLAGSNPLLAAILTVPSAFAVWVTHLTALELRKSPEQRAADRAEAQRKRAESAQMSALRRQEAAERRAELREERRLTAQARRAQSAEDARHAGPLVLARYMGGHPALSAGLVQVQRKYEVVRLTGMGSQAVEVPVDRVTALRWVPSSQVVATGGGTSIAGGVFGGAIGNAIVPGAGLIAGAVMGSRRRTKAQTVRNDVVVLQATSAEGLPVEIYFSGDASVHRKLARALGLSL